MKPEATPQAGKWKGCVECGHAAHVGSCGAFIAEAQWPCACKCYMPVPSIYQEDIDGMPWVHVMPPATSPDKQGDEYCECGHAWGQHRNSGDCRVCDAKAEDVAFACTAPPATSSAGERGIMAEVPHGNSAHGGCQACNELIAALRERVAELEAAIRDASHAPECTSRLIRVAMPGMAERYPCNCWKARALKETR